jgi:molybdopterin-guanine dinucleotide biosynthesis protein B
VEEKMKNPVAEIDKKSYFQKIVPSEINPPIVSIVGKSGSGKTTLLVKLVAELKQRGFRVGTIKHDVHGFEMDRPGKDSWRHKQAGAATTIISSPYQIGMVRDVDHDHQPEELMPFLSDVDVILTEGYKQGNWPKLEIFRSEIHRTPLCRSDDNLLALASDDLLDIDVPRFATDDVKGLVDLLIKHFNLDQIVSWEAVYAK